MRNLRILLFGLFLMLSFPALAQEDYIFEGDTLKLQREVRGPISLFWSEEANRYRYFVQKEDTFIELKNEPLKGEKKRRFQLQLEKLTTDTNISTRDVKFLLYSLKHFVNLYNTKVEEDYEYNTATPNIMQRVGIFTGLSNNKYTQNPENILAPVLGIEYELYDPNLAPRHSAFVHLRQNFEQEEYQYSSTQLSLNYRFKFLYFPGFDVHIDTEFATFYHSRETIYHRNDAGELISVEEENGFSFTAPLSFGIGADIRVTKRGFITIGYNDVVSIVLEGNGSFPVDITVGYKYNL